MINKKVKKLYLNLIFFDSELELIKIFCKFHDFFRNSNLKLDSRMDISEVLTIYAIFILVDIRKNSW